MSVVSEPSKCHEDGWMFGEGCVHGLIRISVVGDAAQLDTAPGHGLGAERGIFVLLHLVPAVRPREARTTHQQLRQKVPARLPPASTTITASNQAKIARPSGLMAA